MCDCTIISTSVLDVGQGTLILGTIALEKSKFL